MIKGTRFNTGKPKLSYLLQFRNAIAGVAEVATFGAEKYSRYNWKGGLDHMEVVDSLLRHLYAYADGEDIDPESGLPHVDHISWNSLALSEMTRIYPEGDNRECKIVKGDLQANRPGEIIMCDKDQVPLKMSYTLTEQTRQRED